MTGDPNAVGNAYHELLFGPPTAAPALEATSPSDCAVPAMVDAGDEPGSEREHRYGDGTARIVDFRLVDTAGRTVTRLRSLDTYTAEMTIRAVTRTAELCAGILSRNGRGQDVFGTDTMRCQNLTFGPLAPGEEATVRMCFRANMAGGTYFFTAPLARYDGLEHDVRFDAISAEVGPISTLFTDMIVNLEVEFGIEQRTERKSEPAILEG
ncbi:MAG TPA: Wzt carbohydrate-binding domain-containing protein [Stellaceae bacterium]|nr:Wzt carbohydrate-binding domain-containing protein [Stellaceae bacterium]